MFQTVERISDGSPGRHVDCAGRGRGRQPLRRGASPLHAGRNRQPQDLGARGAFAHQLFDRTARKLALTVAGSSYVAASKRILADLTEAERAASGEYSAPTGELIITGPVNLGRLLLVPILAEFLRVYPKIDVRLVLIDRIVSLPEDHVDVALRVGVLPDSRLIASRVGSVRRVTCASPAYLAARGTPSTPDDLAGHDCITYESILAPNAWRFVRDKTEITVSVQPRLVVSHVEAACDAALAGIGIARVFYHHVAASIEAGTLVTVLADFETKTLPANLIYAAGRFLPIKVRAFLDFAAPRLKAQLTRY